MNYVRVVGTRISRKPSVMSWAGPSLPPVRFVQKHAVFVRGGVCAQQPILLLRAECQMLFYSRCRR